MATSDKVLIAASSLCGIDGSALDVKADLPAASSYLWWDDPEEFHPHTDQLTSCGVRFNPVLAVSPGKYTDTAVKGALPGELVGNLIGLGAGRDALWSRVNRVPMAPSRVRVDIVTYLQPELTAVRPMHPSITFSVQHAVNFQNEMQSSDTTEPLGLYGIQASAAQSSQTLGIVVPQTESPDFTSDGHYMRRAISTFSFDDIRSFKYLDVSTSMTISSILGLTGFLRTEYYVTMEFPSIIRDTKKNSGIVIVGQRLTQSASGGKENNLFGVVSGTPDACQRPWITMTGAEQASTYDALNVQLSGYQSWVNALSPNYVAP